MTDQIANIRWIMEKAREFQKNIYFCFIDYAKAFDCVHHNQLWKILKTGWISLPRTLEWVAISSPMHESEVAQSCPTFCNPMDCSIPGFLVHQQLAELAQTHNFPQFIVIHTVKGFGIVNKEEIDVFLELSCFFHDPADVGNLKIGRATVFTPEWPLMT